MVWSEASGYVKLNSFFLKSSDLFITIIASISHTGFGTDKRVVCFSQLTQYWLYFLFIVRKINVRIFLAYSYKPCSE
jgi:hypothetical protein